MTNDKSYRLQANIEQVSICNQIYSKRMYQVLARLFPHIVARENDSMHCSCARGCKLAHPAYYKYRVSPGVLLHRQIYTLQSVLSNMAKAVILVGGETTGTRFRPLTMDYIKCLFPIAGKPIISHILCKLIKDLGDELEEVFLISFFKDPSKFDNYLKASKKEFPGLKVTLLTEPTPMGTGGGIFFFKDQVLGNNPESPILFIHADIVCDYPFKEMVEFQKGSKADIAIMGVDPLVLLKEQVFQGLDKEQVLRRYGTVFSNRETHDVVHYVEKPESDSFAKFSDTNYQTSINGGIYVFGSSIFKQLEEANIKKVKSLEFKASANDLEEPYNPDILSLELDVFKGSPSMEKSNFRNFGFNKLWYQLSTPRIALAANEFFLKQDPGQLSGCITPPTKILSKLGCNECKIGPNVTIGANVTLGEGTRLKNCIICDNVTIGAHTIITNAIISLGVKVGKWCRVEGTLSAPINQASAENDSKFLGNLVVLCKDVQVSNQVFVYNSVVLPHKELKSDTKYEIVM